tara:strand:+ start:350 stop:829 length:480 start_codon:yes stop_codon:yes gene_type:complete
MSTIFANKIKNNQGGNNVKINQLSGIDTAGSIIHAASTSTVQGGGTATTNLEQGLAKNRLYYNMVSNSIISSFNTSSVTDGSAGRISISLTSAYTSLNDYQALGYGNAYNGDSWGGSNTTPVKVNWAFTNTTSLYDFTSHAGAYTDGTYNYAISYGDLA